MFLYSTHREKTMWVDLLVNIGDKKGKKVKFVYSDSFPKMLRGFYKLDKGGIPNT